MDSKEYESRQIDEHAVGDEANAEVAEFSALARYAYVVYADGDDTRHEKQ
jgi:hypothetical protein